MTLHAGDDLVVSILGPGDEFVPVAGLRSRNIALRANTADASHAESGPWRQLLPGGGLRQATVAGSGVFLGDAAASLARAAFFAGDVRAWRISVPGAGMIEGAFDITALDFAGAPGGEASVAITLTSAGHLTFTEETLS